MDFTYPYTDFHEMNLDWFLAKFKEIEELVNGFEADLSDVQGDISTIQSDITAIRGQITTITGNITTLRTDMTAAQSAITALQGSVTTLISDMADVKVRLLAAEGTIGTLDTRLTNLSNTVSQIAADYVDYDTLNIRSFVPQLIGGDGVTGYLYNDGSEIPDEEVYLYAREESIIQIDSDFDDTEGSYPPVVFIPLYQSIAHCNSGLNPLKAYIIMFCPFDGVSGEILFCEGHNLDSGYKAIGMNFTAHSGMNVIEFTPTAVYGGADGTTDVNYIAFKFDSLGNKTFDCCFTFEYNKNSLESVGNAYAMALHAALQKADRLPEVSSSDAGKFLVVNNNGNWTAATVPAAEDNNF